jgi:hypothetical protein
VQLLWYISTLFQIALLALLFVKRQDRVYPAFTIFIAISCSENVTLFLFRYSPAAYFYTYWVATGVCALLKCGVLVELFFKAFQPETMERGAIRRLYTVQGILVATSVAAAFIYPSDYPVRLMAIIRTADMGASLMLSLSVIALIVALRIEGMYCQRRTRAIALGLLLYLPLDAIVVAFKGHAWPDVIARIRWIEVVGFLGTLILWMRAFARPEVARMSVPVKALEQLASRAEKSL